MIRNIKKLCFSNIGYHFYYTFGPSRALELWQQKLSRTQNELQFRKIILLSKRLFNKMLFTFNGD